MAKVEDGLLAIDRASGYCYALNTTGALIWELLAEPKQISAVCEEMCTAFAVDRDTCLEDILSAAAEMQRAGLVR